MAKKKVKRYMIPCPCHRASGARCDGIVRTRKATVQQRKYHPIAGQQPNTCDRCHAIFSEAEIVFLRTTETLEKPVSTRVRRPRHIATPDEVLPGWEHLARVAS